MSGGDSSLFPPFGGREVVRGDGAIVAAFHPPQMEKRSAVRTRSEGALAIALMVKPPRIDLPRRHHPRYYSEYTISRLM
jgi:hypothetical protein